jgi:hypothetical protein
MLDGEHVVSWTSDMVIYVSLIDDNTSWLGPTSS